MSALSEAASNEDGDIIRSLQTRIRELEAMLYAVGAGGVGKVEQPQPDTGIPASVPAGWKLVPVEPTRDMIAAAAKDESSKEHPTYASMYAAMLDAAPQPERQPLTDEQILEVMREWPVETNVWADHIDFARAIERAHGIGGEE